MFAPSFTILCSECEAAGKVVGAYKEGLTWNELMARVRERLVPRGWRYSEYDRKDRCPKCVASLLSEGGPQTCETVGRSS